MLQNPSRKTKTNKNTDSKLQNCRAYAIVIEKVCSFKK